MSRLSQLPCPSMLPRASKLKAAVSMLALACVTATAFAAPALALDAREKAEMGQFVREYLLDNPELLLEVQEALQAKQESQRGEKSTEGIVANKAAIFSAPTDVVLGNPEGDVTVVEFFDYNCGYCKRALSDMDALLAKDNNIRFVLKEFPILGPDSMAAHQVANAVRLVAPEKYEQFHRDLLSQPHASGDSAIAVAKALGIDEAAIRKSIAENPNEDLVRQTYALANAIGITGTPTYIIGDEAVFGAQGMEAILAKVANVRECGKANC